MAIQAKLFIDNEFYTLKYFEWGIIQGSDANYQPTGKIRQIGLTLIMDAQSSSNFEEWSFESHMPKNLEIHMIKAVLGQGKTRILKCFDCHLLELNTNYQHQSNELPSFRLYITCGGIEPSWSTSVYSELWRKTFIAEGETTVIEEELEPQFLGYYIEDEKGNNIQQNKIKIDQKIVLVIETENADDDTITIDLDDDNLDYEYNGIALKNDVLEGIIITGEQTRIELKAIKQN